MPKDDKAPDPMRFLMENQNPKDEDEIKIEDETDEEKKARIAKEEKDAADKKKKDGDDDKKNKDKQDQSVGELKKRKIQLEKELEESKEKIKKLEGLKEFEALKPLNSIGDYIKKKFGAIDEESINKFIDHNKKRKGELTEAQKRIAEKENRIKEFDITSSDEWKTDYAEPISKADDTLVSLIVNTDNEGHIKHPELFKALRTQLLAVDKEGKPLTSVQIKGILQKFSSVYTEQTKEDYEVPMLNQVVDAVATLNKRFNSAIVAKKDWSKTIEEKQKEKLFDQSKRDEILSKKEEDGRNYAFKKAVDSFDYKAVDGILEEDDVKEVAQKEHENFTKIFKQEEKPFSYDTILSYKTKATLYDKLVEKYRELEGQLTLEKKKNKSGLPADSTDPDGKERRTVEKKDHSKDLTGFLK